jgi:hypothetical protein
VVLSKENHAQLTEAATLDRKSMEAEGSAVPRISPGNAFNFHPMESFSTWPPAPDLDKNRTR